MSADLTPGVIVIGGEATVDATDVDCRTGAPY
jgi:hypothetical protein